MPRTPRLRASALALVLAAASATACSGEDESGAVHAAALAYVTSWSEGDLERAAAATDRPQVAGEQLAEVRESLAVRAFSGQIGAVPEPEDGRVSAPVDVTMTLAGLGDWSFSTMLPMRRVGEGDRSRWVITWSPAVIHPKLTGALRLGRSRSLPERAPILGRDGQALMSERPVVDIGVEPRRLTAPERAYRALADLGVDPAGLRGRVASAQPDHFVPAITLRREQFSRYEERLRAVPGLVFREGTRTLAPSPTFGRAVLGSVRAATEETLADAGPLAAATDFLGSGGLQGAFQQQLAGRPSGEVRLVSRATGDVASVLHEFAGAQGEPLRTTLDQSVQEAAERALAGAREPAALVAVRPSTGEVLAAANTPADSSFNRALVGEYPPGSTFKVVTASALVRDGLRPSDAVPCPATVTVEGKRFENYDDLGALGRVPFARDFTLSCNTAFIDAALGLDRQALSDTAGLFGLGGEWDLGVGSFSGSVPVPRSDVDQAAAAIGQGQVLASPLAMAVVAAAVQSGTPRTPTLLAGREIPAVDPLPAEVAETVRRLMLDTVEDGTAEVLALPGTPVGAKTGTAEFGTESPPRTHAWMVGFRGDLAFAVLVEDGGSGSRAAGPVARRFLRAAT